MYILVHPCSLEVLGWICSQWRNQETMKILCKITYISGEMYEINVFVYLNAVKFTLNQSVSLWVSLISREFSYYHVFLSKYISYAMSCFIFSYCNYIVSSYFLADELMMATSVGEHWDCWLEGAHIFSHTATIQSINCLNILKQWSRRLQRTGQWVQAPITWICPKVIIQVFIRVL
jgi:hypothetical protein